MPLITSFPAEKNPNGIFLLEGCKMRESDIQSISVVDKAFEGLLRSIMNDDKTDVINIINKNETFTNNQKENIVESALRIALENGKYKSFGAILEWISDNPSVVPPSSVKACLSRELVNAVEVNDSAKFREIINTGMFNASDALILVVNKENQRLNPLDRRRNTPPNRRYMMMDLLTINKKDCQPNQKSVEEALNHAVDEHDDEIILAINNLNENRPQLAVYEKALKTATRSLDKDRVFTIYALNQIILPERAKLEKSAALAATERSAHINKLVAESKRQIAEGAKPPTDMKPAYRPPKKKEDLAVRFVREAELHVHPIRDFDWYTLNHNTDENAPNYSQNKDVIQFLDSSQANTPPKKLIDLRLGATDQPIDVSAITENNDTTLSSIGELPRKTSKLYSDSEPESWDYKPGVRKARNVVLYSVNANRLEKKMMEELADLDNLYQRLEIIKPFKPNETNTTTWVSKIKENNPKLDDALLKMQLDDSKREFNTYLKDIADTEAMLQELSQRIEHIQKRPPVDLDVLEDYIVLLNVERRRLAYSINKAEALLYIPSPEQKKEPPVERVSAPSKMVRKPDLIKKRVVNKTPHLPHQKSVTPPTTRVETTDEEVRILTAVTPSDDGLTSEGTFVTETPRDPLFDTRVQSQGMEYPVDDNGLGNSTPRFKNDSPIPSSIPQITSPQKAVVLSKKIDDKVGVITPTASEPGLSSGESSPVSSERSFDVETPRAQGKPNVLWRAHIMSIVAALSKIKTAKRKGLVISLATKFDQCTNEEKKENIYKLICICADVTSVDPKNVTRRLSQENLEPNLISNKNIIKAMVAVITDEPRLFSNKNLKNEKNVELEKIILNYINADTIDDASNALNDFVELASQFRGGLGKAEFGKTTSMKVFAKHLGVDETELLAKNNIYPPQCAPRMNEFKEFKEFKGQFKSLRNQQQIIDSTTRDDNQSTVPPPSNQST